MLISRYNSGNLNLPRNLPPWLTEKGRLMCQCWILLHCFAGFYTESGQNGATPKVRSGRFHRNLKKWLEKCQKIGSWVKYYIFNWQSTRLFWWYYTSQYMSPIYKVDSPYPIHKPSIPTSPTLILLFFITQNRWGRIHTKTSCIVRPPRQQKSGPFPKPKVSQGILRAKKHTSQHGCFETGPRPHANRGLCSGTPPIRRTSFAVARDESPTRTDFSSLWRRIFFLTKQVGFQSRCYFLALNGCFRK